MDNYLDTNWEKNFVKAKEYYEKHNNLLVRNTYTIDGFALGNWIQNQRQRKRKGKMSNERIEKLNSIGMNWEVNENRWLYMYGLAKEYYEKYLDLAIPSNYITKNGDKLGSWISNQRNYYKLVGTENRNKKFTNRRIELLNDIEMIWENPNPVSSTSIYEQAVFFYVKQCDDKAENRYLINGVELDVYSKKYNIAIEYDGEMWHKSINKDKKKNRICQMNKITLIRIREPRCPKLNDTSIDYYLLDLSISSLSNVIKLILNKHFHTNLKIDINKDRSRISDNYLCYQKQHWKEMYYLAKQYYKDNGNLIVHYNYSVDGYQLGSWIHTLRRNRNSNSLFYSNKQIKMLDDIGMVWNVNDNQWNNMYLMAKEYYEKNGDLVVPKKQKKLSLWLSDQKTKMKKNKLPTDQIKLLENIGIDWKANENQWNRMFQLAKYYYELNGNLLVPYKYILKNEKLGEWITTQRRKYRNPRTNGLGILTHEQIEKLNTIGMVWDVSLNNWNMYYKLSSDYFNKHNNLNIKKNYVVNGIKLGEWISLQRRLYRIGARSLTNDRKAKLDRIGMIWNTSINSWDSNYELCREYFIKNGNLRIKQNYEIDGVKLGKWISRLRKQYIEKNKLLTNDKIIKLNEIGMIWDIYDKQWFEYYEIAKDCYKETGTINHSQKYYYKDKLLGDWIYTQKVKYRKSELNKEKVLLLNKLNIKW